MVDKGTFDWTAQGEAGYGTGAGVQDDAKKERETATVQAEDEQHRVAERKATLERRLHKGWRAGAPLVKLQVLQSKESVGHRGHFWGSETTDEEHPRRDVRIRGRQNV